MATVKGDVHDIGKNIVGVVLGCNNYEIIDLGVMVPAEKILDTAVAEGVDMIGLSGLITPSLDEMVHVAREMQERGLKLPLLIGGATTSAKHTAIKIAPAYHAPTIHVNDASRSVGVVDKLKSDEHRDAFVAQCRAEQQKIADAFDKRSGPELAPYAEAIEKRYQCDWATATIDRPEFIGTRVLDPQPLAELVPYIDWSPFFRAWELRGKYPAILDDDVVGEEARKLFEDAQRLLGDIVGGDRVSAKGVYGFWPAASDGDDVVLFADESRTSELTRFHTLRQQWRRKGTEVFYALADFVAPIDSGREDYVGGFVVTAGHGVDALVKQYEADHDDYQAIMVKALADRLAEAFAESLHRRVRAEWGYGNSEQLSNEQIIKEKYRGIRPAAGYPASPDHTEKRTLFELLAAEKNTGVCLTENFAMTPAASVSGLYFAHPDARYFAVDRVTREQVEAYAKRKGMTVGEVQRWLAPNLGYEPS
jgi:5-methyltetrahydrofolate--homocysteine methyltransferase